MQSHTPIPPPRLPPTRPALQDVTTRANQSLVTLPPINPNVKPSMGSGYWERERARARDEAESLRNMYQQTAVDVGRRAPAPSEHRNPFSQPVPTTQGNFPPGIFDMRAQQALATARPAAPAPAASNSRKRKSEASPNEAVAAYKQKLGHIDVSEVQIDLDCNQVRSLIRRVTERGIYKKGEFCTAIGCSPTAVNRFLEKTGVDGGLDSDVYECAWAFFKKRELAGLSMPPASAIQQQQKKAKTTAARASVADLGSIRLEGEETDSVPVFETCDVVRRKIAAHLRKPGVTQAQFCRDLHAQLRTNSCKSIQSKMLNDFRAKKGPIAGCTSSVYYAAYVYFEKLRIAEGKPKSKHRLEMENIYPTGADRENDGRHGYTCHVTEQLVEDEYGRMTFVRIR